MQLEAEREMFELAAEAIKHYEETGLHTTHFYVLKNFYMQDRHNVPKNNLNGVFFFFKIPLTRKRPYGLNVKYRIERCFWHVVPILRVEK